MYRWRYLDARGEAAGRSDRFPDRESAEGWLGAAWEELVDREVEEVVLEDEGGRPVYRMSLLPGD